MTSNYKTLLGLLREIRTLQYFELGSLLALIKAEESYRTEIGAGIETWHQFLSQPEIGMTVNEANYLIKVFELANNVDFDIRTIPPKSLKLILTKNLPNDLFHEAATLSTADFKELHFDAETGKEERTYEYLVMKRCNETGGLSKVNGVESQEVQEAFKDKIYG